MAVSRQSEPLNLQFRESATNGIVIIRGVFHPLIMENDRYLNELQQILEDSMEIDRKAIAEIDEKEISDIIKGKCVECGTRYYSDYLMPNFDNCDEMGNPVDELCIECYLERSQ